METTPPAGAERAPSPALAPGVRVHLRDEGGAACVSEIAEVGPDRLALRLLDPAPEGAFEQGASVDLSVTVPGGLFRSTTTVAASDLEDALVHLSPPPAFTRLQRRAHPRAPVTLTVTAQRVRAGGLGESLTVQVMDLSRGGMRLGDPAEDLDVGHVVQVALPIDEPPVRIRGLVVATRPQGEGSRSVHVAFSSASDAALARLERYVGERLG